MSSATPKRTWRQSPQAVACFTGAFVISLLFIHALAPAVPGAAAITEVVLGILLALTAASAVSPTIRTGVLALLVFVAYAESSPAIVGLLQLHGVLATIVSQIWLYASALLLLRAWIWLGLVRAEHLTPKPGSKNILPQAVERFCERFRSAAVPAGGESPFDTWWEDHDPAIKPKLALLAACCALVGGAIPAGLPTLGKSAIRCALTSQTLAQLRQAVAAPTSRRREPLPDLVCR